MAKGAPGVVYTPGWLAAAVVDRALAPHADDLAGLTLLDPACGDGALLVAALEWLAARRPAVDRPTLARTHLFGVDVDPAAVAACAARLAAAAGCPPADLAGNLRCADALLGPDDLGAYDVVVGNPPYFSADAAWGPGSAYRAALAARYPQVDRDKIDVLAFFFVRSAELATRSVTLLVSRTFLRAHKGDRLRAWLAPRVEAVWDLGQRKVFGDVGIEAAVVRLRPAPTTGPVIAASWGEEAGSATRNDEVPPPTVGRSTLGAGPWLLRTDGAAEWCDRLDAVGPPLGGVLRLGKGMETGANGVFGGLSAGDVAALGLPRALVRRRARGRALSPFRWTPKDEHLLFVPAADHLDDLPPGARAHLEAHRARLEGRAAVRRGDRPWWRFTWPLHAALQARPRILCPGLSTGPRFARVGPDDPIGLSDTTVIFDAGQPEDLRYVLGLLQSRVLGWRHRQRAKRRGGAWEFYWNTLRHLPLRRIDFADPGDRRLHGAVVAAVHALEADPSDAAGQEALDAAVCALYGVPAGALPRTDA